jgi:apolipoprotein N-acyltransferase
VAWVFFEWFCSWFLTGLPWLLLGQSQASTWLGAYAPVISTYGVSFMVVVIAGLIVNAIIFKKYWLNSFIIASIILTGALLNHISWTTPVTKDPLKVALIQGNIPMTMITTVANVETAFIRYLDLTKKNIDAQLIVLPESAFLIHEDDIPIYFNYLNKLLVTHHAAMITGIAYQDRTTHESFGAAKVFGEGYGIYFKQHLVPLGEYMPFSHYLPKDFRLLNYFPIANITAGKSQQPLMMVQHIPVGTVLCNDLTYIPVILNKLPAAQLLVSLNNLSWYGHSWGAAQQLQIAQMRALEAGRYLLVVGNDGVTAIIDNHGRIVGSIPRFSVQVLRGEVYPMQGSTPLVIIGWIPLFLLALAWGIIGFFLNRRAKL